MSVVSAYANEENRRRSILQKKQHPLYALTDLFLSAVPQLDDNSVEIVDTAFDLGLRISNVATLADISARIACVPNAPPRLIKRLACDTDISIAGPVLSQSPRLGDRDLCEIAAVSGNSHLLAISTRKRLASSVTDILLVRGDKEVVRNVVGNIAAELSNRGVARLLELAEGDRTIGARLNKRTDLPPSAIGRGSTHAVSRRKDGSAKIAAAERFAITLEQTGKLTEAKISALAAENRYQETIATISLMSRLKYQLIERMLRGPRLRELALVCKSLGFGTATMDAIWNLTISLNGTTQDEIRDARGEFLATSTEIAESVHAAMSSLHPSPIRQRHDGCSNNG